MRNNRGFAVHTPSRRFNVRYIIAAAAVILVGLLIWQYLDARAELRKLKDPQVAIEEESKDTVGEVSKIMLLPESETPTVANISDVGKLKDRPFFERAENGDKVLIYQESQKAIIYRPSTKQIVEVARYSSDSGLETNPDAQ